MLYFSGGSHETAKGGAAQSRTKTDPLDSRFGERINRIPRHSQTHHYIDRLRDGRTNERNGFEAQQRWHI
jgi:hypothetical protein